MLKCTNISTGLHLQSFSFARPKLESHLNMIQSSFGTEPHKTGLTIQEDVVTFTPAAPQRRITPAGAADLDGVVHTGLQVQRRLGVSRHGHNLET